MGPSNVLCIRKCWKFPGHHIDGLYSFMSGYTLIFIQKFVSEICGRVVHFSITIRLIVEALIFLKQLFH